MSHQERRNTWYNFPRVLNHPFNIPELEFPVRLCVRTAVALIRRIQRGLSKPTSVVGEHSDTFLWVPDVHVFISADMFSKTMDENEECLGLIGLIGASVKLGSSGAS